MVSLSLIRERATENGASIALWREFRFALAEIGEIPAQRIDSSRYFAARPLRNILL